MTGFVTNSGNVFSSSTSSLKTEILNTLGAPTGGATSYHSECRDSRNIVWTVQKNRIIFTFQIGGRPDIAAADPFLREFVPGQRLETEGYENYFVSTVTLEHMVMNAQFDPTEGDPPREWTKATVVFETQPCPGTFSLEWTYGMVMYPEWYSRVKVDGDGLPDENGTVSLLTNLRAPVNMPAPSSVVRIYYPSIRIPDISTQHGERSISQIEEQLGTLNSSPFLGRPAGYWLCDGLSSRPLAGNGNPTVASPKEVTITLRGDPIRKHRSYYPKIVAEQPLYPIPGASYDDMHSIVDFYPRTSFAVLLRLGTGFDCNNEYDAG